MITTLVNFPFKVFFRPALFRVGCSSLLIAVRPGTCCFCTLNRPLEEVVLSSFLQRLVLATEINPSDGVFSS